MDVKPRLPRGRQFFANPGPTNIPDSILHAVAHVTVDFNDPAFLAVYDRCVAGLKRVLRTEQSVFMYTGSGHAAWEASMVNLFSPGDTLLVIESGYFSENWARMAQDLGLVVRSVAADWRRGAEIGAVEAALAADAAHEIKAVCAVHNETATGMVLPLPAIRAAMDAAGHPALLLADTISSLGSLDFRMDEWGVDVAVGGSQKGLMLPTGMSFTGVSARAMAAHATSRLPKSYFNWTNMLARRHRSFVGTVPTSLFYGLEESLRLIEEEGLEQVFARHARLAEAVRRCVRHWSGNDGPQLFCLSPDRYSDSVTAILLPEGHDAERVRRIALEAFNVSLGGGLGRLGGKVFRIGHLGDLNEPMILGTLASVEMALRLAGVPHNPGGVAAAMDWLAEAAGQG
ncbi:aminotransferase class V-fold PLP-dependent enzyme [Roseomonas alkaliterrae]|uniref:Alanine-glyoxylate transaminase/serine-glyoxylate transaminase/serine-pyruvate transaminase n=1 Tax=Neoroseomonas alkaliterrae TaxID=1452450 RepID=A0A840XI43_9PROT|nr:aminotransferase class V-fold PLP-dependent enzyme [Neoroseomonas alkaliterrae]MBB5688118.1 alanine-glyoxylate transaminase/serine-glyoxylate transaminase/serine-pyruvate transaminase [Neoroseomonas alkaliterrae]MBR0677364.1 aminotransferase class V-fold PLP-dependent enzyme [Neoroseomonas alkaliterrae]